MTRARGVPVALAAAIACAVTAPGCSSPAEAPELSPLPRIERSVAPSGPRGLGVPDTAGDLRDILVDATGAVWFATARGLHRYRPDDGSWRAFSPPDPPQNSREPEGEIRPKIKPDESLDDQPGHVDIRAIAEAPDGALWVATARGAGRLDADRERWTWVTAADGLASDDVTSVYVDPSGNEPGAEPGVTVFLGTARGLTRYRPDADNPWRTVEPGRAITALAGDGVHLWIGLAGGRLVRRDLALRGTRTFRLDSATVTAIAVEAAPRTDAARAVWIASRRGLYRASARDDPRPVAVTWPAGESDDAANDGAGGADLALLDLAVDTEGAVWLATSRGVLRWSAAGSATALTRAHGLPDDDVRAVAAGRDGLVWLGFGRGAVARIIADARPGDDTSATRYRPAVGSLASAGGSDLDDEPSGPLVGTDPAPPADVLAARTSPVRAIAIADDTLVVAQRHTVRAIALPIAGARRQAAPAEYTEWRSAAAEYTALAPGPDGWVWAGTALGGLFLFDTRTLRPLPVTLDDPSSDRPPPVSVTALATVPGAAGRRVWVGTARGLALIRIAQTPAANAELRAEIEAFHAFPYLPAGPPDALVASADGTVFAAFNALPAPRFVGEPKLAATRARTALARVSPAGSPRLLDVASGEHAAFESARVRGLSFSARHGLWVASSSGLFLSPGGTDPMTQQADLLLALPVRSEAIAQVAAPPGDPGVVWMSIDGRDRGEPYLVGYRPATGATLALAGAQGVPSGAPGAAGSKTISGLLVAGAGDLVAIANNRAAHGRVVLASPQPTPTWLILAVGLGAAFVLAALAFAIYVGSARRHFLVRSLCAAPDEFGRLALAEIGRAVRRLRRARLLADVLHAVGIPVSRAAAIAQLAHDRPCGALELRALASLLAELPGRDPLRRLGMGRDSGLRRRDSALRRRRGESLIRAGDALAAARERAPVVLDIERVLPGLWLATLALPEPAHLSEHPLPAFALDPNAALARSSEDAIQRAMEAALAAAGLPFERPYLLLARDPQAHRAMIAHTHGCLAIDAGKLKSLVLAHRPSAALAFFLVREGLLSGLSPYTTAGEVTDMSMFFGRRQLIQRLNSMSEPRYLIVGPRRIGKSSLLAQVAARFDDRTGVEVTYLDFSGVSRHRAAAHRLASKLGVELPDGVPDATAFAYLLRERYGNGERRGVVLIDEFDSLAQADARQGYPLLTAIRTLQAESACSFVLTGFVYLRREILNQRSPLHNFATFTELGPLEPEAAEALAREPMERLGVRYTDNRLPARIAEITGGTPSIIQQLCGVLLETIPPGELAISEDGLAQAESAPRVRGYVSDSFYYNTGPAAQIGMLCQLDRERFTAAEYESDLERAVGRRVPLRVGEESLIQLRLGGFINLAADGGYQWAIPLLRDALRVRHDPDDPDGPARRIRRLVAELPSDPAAWLIVPDPFRTH